MFDFFEKIAEGIGFKLISDFSGKIYDWIKEINKNAENNSNENNIATSGDRSKVATLGNYSQVATSGYRSNVATLGNYSQVATLGDNSKVATLRDYSQVATSGDVSNVATLGNYSQVATSGYYSKVATSGDVSQVVTSGYRSKVATSGYYSKVATSGKYSKVATSGDNSQVATSGDVSQVATSGKYSKVATSGKYSQVATSGDVSKVAIEGNNSVGFACGYKSIIKAKKGTWISLCEYGEDEEGYSIPFFAASAQIGNNEYKDFKGRILKETEYYCLCNKKFYPVDISDGIKKIKISEKKRDGITIIKAIDIYNTDEECYIVKEGELNAHGETLQQALEDLQYKKIKSEEVQAIVKEIKKTGKVNKAQYRAITGACQYGTNKFCEEHSITVDEIELSELKKILIDDYGARRFWELIENS